MFKFYKFIQINSFLIYIHINIALGGVMLIENGKVEVHVVNQA